MTSIIPQHYEEYSSELELLDVLQIKSNYFIKCKVQKGKVYKGDNLYIILNKDIVTSQDYLKGNNKNILELVVGPMFINNAQQVPVAVKSEEVLIRLWSRDIFNLLQYIKDSNKLDKVKVVTNRPYIKEMVNLGLLVRKINESNNPFQILNESVITRLFDENETSKTVKILLLKEDIFRDIAEKGLKVVTAPAKYALNNKAKVAIGVALGVIAKKLWDKYSDSCNRPFKNKEEKIRCLQQATERVANEIRREQSACMELQDPVQRRKCLYKVEKMRRQWIQKSAELKEKLYGR